MENKKPQIVICRVKPIDKYLSSIQRIIVNDKVLPEIIVFLSYIHIWNDLKKALRMLGIDVYTSKRGFFEKKKEDGSVDIVLADIYDLSPVNGNENEYIKEFLENKLDIRTKIMQFLEKDKNEKEIKDALPVK